MFLIKYDFTYVPPILTININNKNNKLFYISNGLTIPNPNK